MEKGGAVPGPLRLICSWFGLCRRLRAQRAYQQRKPQCDQHGQNEIDDADPDRRPDIRVGEFVDEDEERIKAASHPTYGIDPAREVATAVISAPAKEMGCPAIRHEAKRIPEAISDFTISSRMKSRTAGMVRFSCFFPLGRDVGFLI